MLRTEPRLKEFLRSDDLMKCWEMIEDNPSTKLGYVSKINHEIPSSEVLF